MEYGIQNEKFTGSNYSSILVWCLVIIAGNLRTYFFSSKSRITLFDPCPKRIRPKNGIINPPQVKGRVFGHHVYTSLDVMTRFSTFTTSFCKNTRVTPDTHGVAIPTLRISHPQVWGCAIIQQQRHLIAHEQGFPQPRKVLLAFRKLAPYALMTNR